MKKSLRYMYNFNDLDDIEFQNRNQSTKHLKDCLPALKKIQREINHKDMVEWFKSNKIDYFSMSDMEMYIYFIENN